ncbi:hypothetical protein KEM60_03027 [Austwickia sp. TVS 96-490-7B]|nr:hypothetical protein [Austwickia sp. TVS 96-490-7B]
MARWGGALTARVTLSVLTCTIAAWGALDALQLWAMREMLDPTGWLRLCSAVTLSALGGWLIITVVACAAAQLPGQIGHHCQRLADACAPEVLRRCAILVLTGATWTPAVAQATPAFTPPMDRAGGAISATLTTSDLPDPALHPDRASPNPHLAPSATAPAVPGETARTVVVRPGDCLWSLAQDALGDQATPARVAQEWPRWLAANRHLVGDPDLIHPGTTLIVPPTETP